MGRIFKICAVLGVGAAIGGATIYYLISTGTNARINEIINFNYLTVKEFAELAGVSKTHIYKKLTGELAPFTKEVNGIKRIHRSALEIV